MQKALVTMLLAAVAGVPTYLLVWASPFGVSRGFPLGQLESMEAWLLDHGFAKKTLSEAEAEKRDLKGAQFYLFTEVGSSVKEDDRQVVALGANSGGAIQSIRTVFYSGKEKLGITSSDTERFAEALWADIAGGVPKFEERHQGSGIRFVQGFAATTSSSSVSGDWYKQFFEVNRPRSIVDFVTFKTR